MLHLQKIINTHKNRLMALDNVVGVGIGNKIVEGIDTGRKALVVMVVEKKSLTELKAEQVVPLKIEDVSTDVIETGSIRLLAPDRRNFQRPANPGVSIGHYMIGAGTFGALVYDNKTNEPYILSNNHVLANTNNGVNGRSKVGDPILQPGPYDGGTVGKDTIAVLTKFSPINYEKAGSGSSVHSDGKLYGQANRVDCALAKPVSADAVTPEVLGVGKVNGTAEGEVGSAVLKSGRTSGITRGKITAVDATVKVNFNEDEFGLFEGQLISNMKSEPGDSGALVLNSDNKAVGLLFAGSETTTVLNPINAVCDALDVHIPEDVPAVKPVHGRNDLLQAIILLFLFMILFFGDSL